MTDGLVRVRLGKVEKNVGAAYAESLELEVLKDEPTHNDDGTLRGETRVDGRQSKPKTTVDEAAKKKESTK